MIKLIATDMDGTFLDDNGHFDHERFERLLNRLDERGIHFVVATGNQVSRMQHVLGDLADRVSYVAGNGSHLVLDGQTHALKEIPLDELQSFFTYFEDKFADYHIVISSPQETYMLEAAWTRDNLADQASLDYYNKSFPGVELVADSAAIPLKNINKITLKVPMAEFDQLMAFGDGENDLSMLALAEYSYAMDNASPVVKAAAKNLAPSNNDQGVMQVIEAYFGA